MVSLWLLGGLSGVLSTCVSLVHDSSMPLIVGACNSSLSTLLADCGVAANTAGFNRGTYCSLLKFGVTADSELINMPSPYCIGCDFDFI